MYFPCLCFFLPDDTAFKNIFITLSGRPNPPEEIIFLDFNRFCTHIVYANEDRRRIRKTYQLVLSDDLLENGQSEHLRICFFDINYVLN